MDAAFSYLDYQICLSRRSDLVPEVLDRVLQARLPGCTDARWRVSAHETRIAEVATLRFLIEEADAAPQRNRLLVGGEMLLDELFAASPWQSAPLVMEAAAKRAVRPELHVKCRPTDEETWYALGSAPAPVPAPLWPLTTEWLRAVRARPHEIKNVLPVLVNQRRAGKGSDDWTDRAFSATADDEAKTAFTKKARALYERGELALVPEALNAAERRTLSEFERYLDDAAKLDHGSNAPAALRFLLTQIGFSRVEADYMIVLGLAGRKAKSIPGTKEAA